MRKSAGTNWRRAFGIGAWGVLLFLLPGCPPVRWGVAPRDAHEALRRVNDNLAKIAEMKVEEEGEALFCKPALVSFRFRDADQRDHRFIGHAATLIFQPPRSLYFAIKSLTGDVAMVGSNAESYWIWVEPELHKMWWGRWATLESGAVPRLLIPPDQLLDVLMWRPIPEALKGGGRPLLVKRLTPTNDCEGYSLLFSRTPDNGWPYTARELKFKCLEPYQPSEIIDRKPDGTVLMHATLENYQRVGEDGPWIPRRYVVNWPLSGTEMRLDIEGAKFRKEQAPQTFDRPEPSEGWEVEQIDADVEASPAAQRAEGP